MDRLIESLAPLENELTEYDRARNTHLPIGRHLLFCNYDGDDNNTNENKNKNTNNNNKKKSKTKNRKSTRKPSERLFGSITPVLREGMIFENRYINIRC